MECPHVPELLYSEFGKRLWEAIGSQRVPLSGSLELTFRCNLRCVHCYLAHGHQGIPDKMELSYEEICGILDQIAGEGALWLLLTGGEPLVRRDFADIYTYAKRKGFLVTLFTNGTLLTPELADLLAEFPPFKVEITLYGMTQETYERITGIPGSYARCMRGIELLVERGIRLNLKTVLLTLNKHELWDIKDFADSLGAGFRYDPMINAGVDGSRSPLAFRLSPEDIVAFDEQDEERAQEWREFCEKLIGPQPDRDDRLYICGAGVNTFHIDPYGGLSVCLISREPSYDLRSGTFREGWWEVFPQVRARKHSATYRCNRCELVALCGQCPGWGILEHNDPEKPVGFLCQLAHLRAKAFGSLGTFTPDPFLSDVHHSSE